MNLEKTYSLLASLSLLALLSACGGSDNAGENTQSTPPTPPVSEFSKALDYNISGIQQDTLNFEEGNLVDYYKVDINATGKYTFYLESLPAGTNIDSTYYLSAKIYDKSETLLKEVQVNYKPFGSVGNENNTLAFDVTTAGTHYIKFTRLDINRIMNIATTYQFHIEPSIANGLVQDSDNEYNDVQSQATPLNLAEFQVDVNGTLSTTRHTDHIDWYELKNLVAGKYTIFMKTKPGTVFRSYGDSIVADIYNKYEVNYTNYRMDITGALDDANKWQREVFEVTTPGSYYLKLDRYDLAANYSFKVIPSVANGYVLDADDEPNDEMHLSKAIVLSDTNTTLQNSVMITDTMDSDDWYTFTADVSQVITLKAETLTGTVFGTYGLHVDVVNKYGIVIKTVPSSEYALNGENQAESGTFSVVSGDDYYIHINRGTNLPTPYKITLQK